MWYLHGEELVKKQKQLVSYAISTNESEHPKIEYLVNDAERFQQFQVTNPWPDNTKESSMFDVN